MCTCFLASGSRFLWATGVSAVAPGSGLWGESGQRAGEQPPLCAADRPRPHPPSSPKQCVTVPPLHMANATQETKEPASVSSAMAEQDLTQDGGPSTGACSCVPLTSIRLCLRDSVPPDIFQVPSCLHPPRPSLFPLTGILSPAPTPALAELS